MHHLFVGPSGLVMLTPVLGEAPPVEICIETRENSDTPDISPGKVSIKTTCEFQVGDIFHM